MARTFHFIAGTDDFLVARTGRELWAQLSAGIEDEFGAEVIDGQVATVGEVEKAIAQFSSAVRTLPMFGDRKVVWFRNITFLAENKVGKAEGTLAQLDGLQQVIESLEGGVVQVLMTAAPFDRRRRFNKWLLAREGAQFIDSGKAGDIGAVVRMVLEEAPRLGVEISEPVATALVEKIGGNTRLAIEEVRKLANYIGAGGGAIEQQHITELVPTFGESDFFEAAEAFYALDLTWTLDAIRRHFFAGNEARSLLASLMNRNRILIQLKVLQDAGQLRGGVSRRSLDDAAAQYAHHFGDGAQKSGFNVFTQHPFYLSRLARPLAAIRLRRLIDFQGEFVRAFEELIARSNDEEMVIREMALRCLAET